MCHSDACEQVGDESDEACKNNAMYALSAARKVDCTLFLLWEDIVEVKPKMIMTLVGSMMARGSR